MWFKKEEIKEETKRNELYVRFKDGTSRRWWVSDYKSDIKITPWKEFYKWFFCRNSEYYTIKTKDFDVTFLRANIIEFRISILND